MPTKRISQVFKELPFEKKLLGVGSLMLIVSLFLPWYQDLDSFKTGDMFLGVTGPLYFAGYSLFLIGVLNIIFLGMEYAGKKLQFMNLRYSSFYFGSALFTFFILLLVNSVYFHSKFGINITLKQSQFGMFFAFIAWSLMTIGGYLASRDKASLLREFQEEIQDPFIQLPKQEKPKESLRKEESPREEVFKSEVKKVEQEPLIPVQETVTKSSESKSAVAKAVEIIREEKREEQGRSNDPQPFRTDL